MRLARGLAKRVSGTASPGMMLATAEGVILGLEETAKGKIFSTSVAQGLKGPTLLTAKAPASTVPAEVSAALDKFRAMSDSRLLRISKTQRRLAALKGKRRHLIKRMRADGPHSPGRPLSSEMTAVQKRAFAQVLVERKMGREALRVVADWEYVENLKASVARELAERGEKIRPPTGPESISKGIYSQLDDASLARLAEEAGELLKKEAGRKAHVSRMWPDADPYVVNEIANLGESRGVLEILDLCRVKELSAELALRGFADDALVLDIRIAKAGH